MFENNLIAGAAGQAGGFYPYQIDQSLRFNDDDSAYLERTPATAGNRKTWTWSGWVKRGNLGVTETFFTGGNNSNDYTHIQIRNDDLIQVAYWSSGYTWQVKPSNVLRDVSAWYHLVVALDTTQSTSTDRVKIYINGERVTAFDTATYPSQNSEPLINAAVSHEIGRALASGTYHLDGYLAEINFIDGQALDPTSFGEFKSGVWVAKRYTGTYGTNGFYLPFENGLGDDESGNGNDWTANNLVATDVVLDSPTNNFATLNPLDSNSAVISEGNLRASDDGSNGWNITRGTFGLSSGKWYWEMTPTAINDVICASIATQDASLSTLPGQTDDFGVTYYNNGILFKESTQDGIAYGAGYGFGDIIGIALDMDAGSVTFYKNNVSQGTASSNLFTYGDTWFAASGTFFDNTSQVFNFGQDSSFAGNETAQGNTDENGIGDFYYTPPAGFLALCTANLPDPAIDPAQEESPTDYFNTLTWSGDNTTRNFTGVGFAPDLVWIKSRSDNAGHVLFDKVRGVSKQLSSINTSAEDTSNAFGFVTSFGSDGFTTTPGSFSGFESGNVNMTGRTYVAWNWKAGGAGVTNTDGSITSTVSANTESGFSIVTTDNHAGSETVGHGLDQAPDLIIGKARDSSSLVWPVYHSSLANTQRLRLNDTTAAETNGVWGNTDPTSDVFTFFLTSGTQDYVFYCFHSVDGFSKFGSYTGNGSSDGPFVYTGFRPAFVMIKRTDSTDDWCMFDNRRDGFNVDNDQLFANTTDEGFDGSSFNFLDILSNGFKCRNTASDKNASGGTYIYMAFAETPFRYSLAR